MRSYATPPLLSLPAELRSKIFKTVLGGQVIHIGGVDFQAYGEGYLPNGRCCCCTAKLSDDDCFAKYTPQRKFLDSASADRFSIRHRDCHRYPISRRLQLNVLLVCRQIYQEASSLVFEDNTFTLARPSSLAPFASRLSPWQLGLIRNVLIYSTGSPATWIGPFDFAYPLTGLMRLGVFIELECWFTTLPTPREQVQLREYLDRRLSGLTMFKLLQLSDVDLMVMIRPRWTEGHDGVACPILEGIESWQTRLNCQLLQPSG